MNAVQNTLMQVAKKHMQERLKANVSSNDAAAVWIEQLRGLMSSIKEWVEPLQDLEGFTIEETECRYRTTDSSGRNGELKGTSLRLWFSDTSILISPQWFQVNDDSLSAGVVKVMGNGMVGPYDIVYVNGSFDTVSRNNNNLRFGDLMFTQILADEVPTLKPSTER